MTLMPARPASAQISIGVNITIEPPALPVYEPPPLPAPGYLWQPGYWAYGPDGYFWVPGTWVEPPQPGLLWTPGYWGFVNGVYSWNAGYWGPHVGFYGGINYGFGYTGEGFFGGEWRGGSFFYNRAVINNFGNVHITNVYNQTIVNRTTITNVSYNGGPHGVQARPTAQEISYAHEQHVPATAAQIAHAQEARQNPALLASANHGNPPIAATQRPREFAGPGVVGARGATLRPEEAAKRSALAPHAGTQRPGETVEPRTEAPRAGSEASRPAETRPASEAMRHETEAPRAEAPRVDAVRPEVSHQAARPEAPHPAAARPAPEHKDDKPKH
jgi:hypothetical protein